MDKGIRRQLRAALVKVNAEISGNASRGHGVYSAGLASEGYQGGYRDALYDVQLALNGVRNTNTRFWPQNKEEDKP